MNRNESKISSSLKIRCKRTVSQRLSQKAFNLYDNKRFIQPPSLHIEGDTEDKLRIEGNLCDNSNLTNPAYEISVKLNRPFFNRPCITLAKSLLGKVLVRKLESDILKGIIVETECYLGVEDKASHSYQGKKTERNEAMFMQPGTAYVYSIYGMYYCFNISSLEEGSAVLIRALEPLHNTSTMLSLRSMKRKGTKVLKVKDICNGPSKLCQALQIDKHTLNKIDLCASEDLWVEEGKEILNCNVVACKRIGIDSAGEQWANKPLRFYVKDCPFVSVRNKLAEANVNSTQNSNIYLSS